MTKFCLIGPTYPYRGGIAHYTTLLAAQLRQQHDTLLISFSQQYPTWLFPGKSDKDPSQRPLQTPADYLLNPINPLTWWRTLQRIRQFQPDVVIIPWWHPFFAPAWTVLGRTIKQLQKRPKLLFICHNVLPHEASLIDKTAVRLALSAGDGFVVHAQSDAENLCRLLPQATVSMTPLPTYAALGQGNASLSVRVPDDRPLLLFFGFVRPYKGLDVLLEALPQVLAKRPLHLLVAGEFWQGETEYQEQIERLGLTTAVTLLNRYLPDEELIACVRAATVVVLPYRTATQSAVVQVAFGQGKPVITTQVGGLAEAVINGRTGLVVPPEDPVALAAAINCFFEEGLGSVFQKNIEQENGRFAWDGLVQRLIQFI